MEGFGGEEGGYGCGSGRIARARDRCMDCADAGAGTDSGEHGTRRRGRTGVFGCCVWACGSGWGQDENVKF